MGSETSFKPVINLSNSIVGVSILAIPYCFSQCGVVLGSLLVVFTGLVTIWSCKMLIRAANMTRSHTYETLALAVCGKIGKLAIEISIIALNIGTCIAYFVIIGDLAPPILAKFIGIHVAPSTFRAMVLVLSALLVAFPLGLLRNVDSLSTVSILSLLFYFLLVVEVMCLSTGNIRNGVWHSEIVWWSNAGILKCLPIISLAFACHTQMFVIYSSLHDPGVRNMSDITQKAVWIICGIYLMVGFFGYITFCKEEIKGDVLANFSLDFISQLTRLGFSLSVVVSFPLMIFPCRTSINSLFCSQAPNELHVQEPIPQNRFIYITAGIVTSTVIIAILIPNIETVLALTGATTGSLICFIFPGLLFLKVAGSSADFSNRAKLVLAIGLVSMVLSTAVVIHTESTRPEAIQLPADVDVDKPDIVKLPPVVPQQPDSKIKDKGVEQNLLDNGGGDVDRDKDRRKELPLPQLDVAEPKKKQEADSIARKPVKPDNPGDGVINIPPDSNEDKHKPAEPDLPVKQPEKREKQEQVKERQPQEEVQPQQKVNEEPAGGHEEEVKKVEEGKAEDKIEGKDKEGVHERLEKHLEKLSSRVDQLEVENKELKEKQEVIQRLQIRQEEEGARGDEQRNMPDVVKVTAEVKKPNKINQETVRQDSAQKAIKPAQEDEKEKDVHLDKHEQAILEALERDDKEKSKQNERLAGERHYEVERRALAAVADKGGVGAHTEESLMKVNEREGRRDEVADKVEIDSVHHIERDELGDNAGNIAPAKGDGGQDGHLPPPPGGEKLESYRKREF